MKNLKCEECVFFDELPNEQPCCGCIDNINFVREKSKAISDLAEEILQEFTPCYNEEDKQALINMIYAAGFRKQCVSRRDMNEYMRKRRAKHLEEGLCINCGKSKPKTGRKYCQECLDKAKHSNEKSRKKKAIKYWKQNRGDVNDKN